MGQVESSQNAPPSPRPQKKLEYTYIGALKELPEGCKNDLALAKIDPEEASNNFEHLLRALLLVYETGPRAGRPPRKRIAAKLNEIFRARYGPPAEKIPTDNAKVEEEVAAEVSDSQEGVLESLDKLKKRRRTLALEAGAVQKVVDGPQNQRSADPSKSPKSLSSDESDLSVDSDTLEIDDAPISPTESSPNETTAAKAVEKTSSAIVDPTHAGADKESGAEKQATPPAESESNNEKRFEKENEKVQAQDQTQEKVQEETQERTQKQEQEKSQEQTQSAVTQAAKNKGKTAAVAPDTNSNGKKSDGLGQRMSHLASITVPTFEFRRSHERYVVFVIEVETKKKQRWSVLRRYSEFHQLHELLLRTGSPLPALPKKRLIGNFDPHFLNRRRQALESYLRALARNPAVLRNYAFRLFLVQHKLLTEPEVPAPPAPAPAPASASKETSEKVENVQSKTMATKPWPELFRQDDPSQYYRSWVKIGEGAFADVYSAIDKRSEEQVAIKVIRNKFIEDRKYITREINVFNNCYHRNLVNLYHCFYFESQVWIIMEFCDCGPLIQLIPEMNFTEERVAFVARQLLHGINCLHEHGYIHRDIKSQNILVSMNGRVKLADFGLCISIPENGSAQGRVGTIHYMAPEIITRRNYNTKVDIWSLGCLIYEMCLGGPPYVNYRSLKAVFKILHVGVPPLRDSAWSLSLHKFLAACFTKDPSARPSAKQLFQMDLIGKAGKASDFSYALAVSSVPSFSTGSD